MEKKITITTFLKKKESGEKIVMITAYDYLTAKLVDETGVDGILVGDSVGTVLLGYNSTIHVTMDEMLHHVKAVARANPKALLVADMPFMSYEVSNEDALRNAGKFIKAGAEAVKLEGGVEVVDRVRALVNAGIPVMGHIGLNPQRIHKLGGYKYRGKTSEDALSMVEDAKALEESDVFAIVIECTMAEVAREIMKRVKIPTICIGSGPYCDGQIIVLHDILGLTPFQLSFVKRYANLAEEIVNAVRKYSDEVRSDIYPSKEYYRSMDPKEYEKFIKKLHRGED